MLITERIIRNAVKYRSGISLVERNSAVNRQVETSRQEFDDSFVKIEDLADEKQQP